MSTGWGRRRLAGALAIMAVLGACAAVFFIDHTLPGLFMDSINPEYLAVRILNPQALPDLPVWIIPGNLIAGKYPVLAGSYYHGPLQLYVSLPVYWLLGHDITAARVAQFMHAGLVLLAAWAVLRRAGVGIALAMAGLLLLAVDPAFVQAFKTQALSILWPLSLLLLAVFLLQGRSGARGAPGAGAMLAAGVLAGLAFFSYFVYLFFAPVLYLYLVARHLQAGTGMRTALLRPLLFAGGYLLGAIPYFVGFGLLYARMDGMQGFVDHLTAGARQLEVIRGGHGVLGRLDRMATNISAAATDTWVHSMVFAKAGKWPSPRPAALLFLAVPMLAGLILWRRRVPAGTLHLVNALMLAYLAGAAFFATRLSGHHYTLLVPLAYLAWTLACHYWLLALPAGHAGRRWAIGFFALAAVVVLVASIHGQARFLSMLRSTGGVHDFSDAINRLAVDAAREGDDRIYYFPDWGFMMPFAFLTGGEVRMRASAEPAPDRLRQMVCRGMAVNVVYELSHPHREPRMAEHRARVAALEGRVPGLEPASIDYLRRDGALAFTVVRFADPERTSPACGYEQLPQCGIETEPGVRLEAEPCQIRQCPQPAGTSPRIDVGWDAVEAGATGVELWVGGGPEKKLWARMGPKGRATTGPWAYPGMAIELRDVDGGARLGTIRLGGRDCRL